MANYFYYGRLTATTPALTREGEDEHTLSSEACAVKLTAFFHTADSPCSHPRATASEDNTALGQLQESPQAPGQTTGVAGARWYAGGVNTVETEEGTRGWCDPSHHAGTVWVQIGNRRGQFAKLEAESGARAGVAKMEASDEQRVSDSQHRAADGTMERHSSRRTNSKPPKYSEIVD
ncbi:UNVERIFIED_CONTAM: hypothetical protein FKN15_036339 [Acipenser sinensis]